MRWQKRSAYGEKMQFRGQIALKRLEAERELMDIIRKFELYQNRCKNAKRQEFANGKRDPMTNIICEAKLYSALRR